MMIFPKAAIEDAAKHVAQYANIEVTYNEKDVLVIADNSQAINEFEAQLAAGGLIWDGEDTNGRVLLDNLVNIQGVRTEFRPRRTNDEWQARYDIVAAA
jgi:hypothetical protein